MEEDHLYGDIEDEDIPDALFESIDQLGNEDSPLIEASPPPQQPQQPQQHMEVAHTFATTQTTFSKRVAERNTPPGKTPKPINPGFGSERYGVRKALFGAITVHNTYLSEPLTPAQRTYVLVAYRRVLSATNPSNPPSLDIIYQQVMLQFNLSHLDAINKGHSAGYGGMIREGTVKACLKQAARPVMQQQIQARASAIAGGRIAPVPTWEQIQGMGRSELRVRLQYLNQVQHGSVAELKDRLKKHYGL
ncbi:hypothetical protein SEMRO_3512_G348770.1 [Seminavis robusta]|uniref:Uncharacterized protein n=1 Tax=Seminavis robusta TaxID=568900 RepID=A0A9N8F0F5_9STRA|nr:hypothetical protein SEMRO_3512_G348770.1 [Seminavis robusta]|eukprot:Sro3512_g348770.1 n/a (248) ;mRNA; r:3630-4373